jgi:hypothetical protein
MIKGDKRVKKFNYKRLEIINISKHDAIELYTNTDVYKVGLSLSPERERE